MRYIITTFLILLGIYRFRLFDIIPIAREKVLALMQDGFFVLDHQNRIIDYNNSTKQFINNNEDLIGKHIEDVLPNQPQLINQTGLRILKEYRIRLSTTNLCIF